MKTIFKHSKMLKDGDPRGVEPLLPRERAVS